MPPLSGRSVLRDYRPDSSANSLATSGLHPIHEGHEEHQELGIGGRFPRPPREATVSSVGAALGQRVRPVVELALLGPLRACVSALSSKTRRRCLANHAKIVRLDGPSLFPLSSRRASPSASLPWFTLKNELAALLGRTADMGLRHILKPAIREAVLACEGVAYSTDKITSSL